MKRTTKPPRASFFGDVPTVHKKVCKTCQRPFATTNKAHENCAWHRPVGK